MYTLQIHKRELPADLTTPVGAYLKIRDLYPASALLESSDYHAANNSVSYIGICPAGSFKVENERIICSFPDGTETVKEITPEVFVPAELDAYLHSFKVEGDAADDVNGLFGFTAYDAVRYFERVEITKRDPVFEGVPDMLYMLFRYVVRINHYRNTMTVFEHSLPGEASGIDEIVSVLRNNNVAQYPFRTIGAAESPITDADYKAIVEKGVRHCMRGDVFQVVLSRRFGQPFKGDEFNVYRALRCVNPSPYLFYFDFGAFRVFGSSPETHLRVQGRTAYIDPIAGTFRRTGDDARDHELARALLEDEKENAEHIMLVDLARNDLARSGGRVSVDFLKQIQFYSHVIHMVSRVKAELPPDADPLRLYAATFPAGTLSGAPKVRAMQIIDDLESHNRMVYGGCIGYIGFSGNLNQAITIRSFLSWRGCLYSQAGAGIVARSVPENELQETNNKLGALVKAVEFAQTF